MKRIGLSALLGMGVVVAIFYSSPVSKAAPTPEDYPLVCRGGGSLATGIAPGEGNIGFTFVRGTKPAGEGLAPGECSWKDRGMYPNEPDRVSQHVEEGSESLKVGGTLAPENRWYEELHSADKYWTFMVSNNGRGQLIATSARPNGGMDVSPTAKVPSEMVPRPAASPGPGMNVRTPGDETPRMIVLKGPPDPDSRAQLMKGVTGGQNINVPPAPGGLSREEKMGLLKLAGSEAFDEKAPPYVRLTPQQPYVAGRGFFYFYDGSIFPMQNHAVFVENTDSECTPLMGVVVTFETKGTYLMTFTVRSEPFYGTPGEFVITIAEPADAFTRQTFLDKKPGEWQRLLMIVEFAKPGEYFFVLKLETKGRALWDFSSCEVTTLKK